MNKEEIIWKLYSDFPPFIPDKIETKLERHGDECELTYKEWFTYMPSDIAEIILPLTKKAWEKYFSFLDFELIDKGIKITHKGKIAEIIPGVTGFVIRESILFIAQNQQKINEMIESLCSERASANLCGKPDPSMECTGLKIKPNTIREWSEKIDKEIREKVENAVSTLEAYRIDL